MTIATTRHSRAAKAKNPYSNINAKPLPMKAGKTIKPKRNKEKVEVKPSPCLLDVSAPAMRKEDKVVYPRKSFPDAANTTPVTANGKPTSDPESIEDEAVESHLNKCDNDQIKKAIPDSGSVIESAMKKTVAVFAPLATGPTLVPGLF